MAKLEAAHYGIPSLGSMVERTDLLRVARAQRPAVTLVCAPPGYGKSVFSAQYAASLKPEHVVWVPLYEIDVGSGEWLSALADALSGECAEGDSSAAPAIPLDVDPPKADAVLQVREALGRYRGRALHLFLDGASSLAEIRDLENLSSMLRELTSPDSMVLLTCRFLVRNDYVPDPANTWMIGVRDLRLSVPETVRMLELCGDSATEERALGVVEQFDGHPALTRLMLRHPNLDEGSQATQDLVWHTRRMVDAMPAQCAAMMYCMALLREGQILDAVTCLAESGCEPADWALVELASPLLSIALDDRGAPVKFRMHAVMCDALIAGATSRATPQGGSSIRRAVVSHLVERRDYGRLQWLLLMACDEDEVAEVFEQHGLSVLHACGSGMMERCLARLSAARVSASARLLLLQSATLRERERPDEAIAHASLARRIAELDGDTSTEVAAVLLEVRSTLDLADMQGARTVLSHLGGQPRNRLDPGSRCLVEGYAAVLEAYAGNASQAMAHLGAVLELLPQVDRHSQYAGWAANCICGVHGQLLGRWDLAAALAAQAAAWPGTSPSQRILCRANAAAALLETGALDEAEALLAVVLPDAQSAGLAVQHAYALATQADSRATRGDAAAQGLYQDADAALAAAADRIGNAGLRLQRAIVHRADGRSCDALALAESTVAELNSEESTLGVLLLSAQVEVAASLLAIGDRWGAQRIITRLRQESLTSDAPMHALCADMVAAEIARQEDDFEAGVALLRSHIDYIATGSANWRIAMYCRAFPGLLAMLADACGVENLPLRMLRLLPPETITAAVASEEALSAQTGQVLLVRSQSGSGASADPVREQPQAPLCHVRFFGGLEVETAAGTVTDRHWRKRKARVLFAMLAVRRGQDVPRDVIFERLWPTMDFDHARRNFYVTWSAMKSALSGGGAIDVSAIAQSVGGVCRVSKSVTSDLAEFDDTLVAIRRAETSNDLAAALEGARLLVSIYRHELLPGDLYDEWFSDVRERTKHDFCDAMLRVSLLAESAGSHDAALELLRRAAAVDPWREDIYQCTMRCQMSSGQRSRAIETYLSCRSRLVDDLGIDPSSETTRLYQAVLAMEV